MKLYFSRPITATCLVLAALMIRASFWQWDRHQEKQELIQKMHSNLEMPVLSIDELLELPSEEQYFRRVSLKGSFDHENEMLLQNRRYEGHPGVFLITPLEVEGLQRRILVNRGFIPTSLFIAGEEEKIIRPKEDVQLNAIVKEPMRRSIFHAPLPKLSTEQLFVREWLLVEPENMQKQLPYKLKPFFIEVIPDEYSVEENLLVTKSGKDELLLLAGRGTPVHEALSQYSFPIPALNTYIPPGRHLGYVYEWAIMALMTLLIGLVLQLRPPRIVRST